MNDRQEDKLSMYYAVAAACDKHNAAWSGLPAFAAAFAEFETTVDAISTAAEGQETGITGATRDKSAARQAMAEQAHPIAAAVQVFASVSGDNQLSARVDFTLSDFLYGQDTRAEERARLVHTEAAAHVADLGDYGVDQAKIDALDAAIEAYHTALTAPRGAITDRKAATAALAEGFDTADTILNNRMDNLVPILAPDQPAFATDYRNARIIVDTGSRSSEPGPDPIGE